MFSWKGHAHQSVIAHIQKRSTQYNTVVLPGKWNVRDAVPERENHTE